MNIEIRFKDLPIKSLFVYRGAFFVKLNNTQAKVENLQHTKEFSPMTKVNKI